MNFFDDNPAFKAKADKLKAEVAYWHNQCHDVALSGAEVSPALREAYKVAEKNLALHRNAERDRYFAAAEAGDV